MATLEVKDITISNHHLNFAHKKIENIAEEVSLSSLDPQLNRV
jgi:hypothetical protein